MQTDKLKFYWHSHLSTAEKIVPIRSTSSTGDFSVDYITNWLEANSFQEDSSASKSVFHTFNVHVTTTVTPDYILMYSSNLFQTGSTYTLSLHEYDSSGFSTFSTTLGFINISSTRRIQIVEFTATDVRWPSIIITASSSINGNVRVMAMGTVTELDYIQPPFDPYAQEIMANVNISQGGVVTGIHEKYVERDIQIQLFNQTTAVYEKVKTWYDTHGAQNFVMAWDKTGHPDDLWLVRPDLTQRNPINVNHFRDITINLKGRKI